jgi:hypothetical protein
MTITFKTLNQLSTRNYVFSFGCIGLSPKDGKPLKSPVDYPISLIVKKLAAKFTAQRSDNEGYNFNPRNIVIGEGLGPSSPYQQPASVTYIANPVTLDFKFTSPTMFGPDVETRTRLVYDGFVYCMVVDISEMREKYDASEHVKQIHKKMKETLEGIEPWNWAVVESNRATPRVELFALREAPPADIKRDSLGIAREWDLGNIALTYYPNSNPDHSVENALAAVIHRTVEDARAYYFSALLKGQIEHYVDEARTLIGEITNSVLSYYDIPFFQIPSRLRKSSYVSRKTACLYALVPQIEKLCDEYENYRQSIVASLSESAGEIERFSCVGKYFPEALHGFLPVMKPAFFSPTVEHMVSHDITEIRSQIQYQFLMISSSLTFTAIILSVVFNLYR